jgi:hypothetical protein
MSFSSSSGSGILSYMESEVTITWQVEQAQDPPQAPIHEKLERVWERWGGDGTNEPSISRSFAWAMSRRLSPSATSKVCSSPSLSTNVTWRLYSGQQSLCQFQAINQSYSSPAFGLSKCP